jgi:hypothetical protein
MPVRFIDTLGSCLSTFGIVYGLICSFYSLLPHNVAPLLSTLLDETQQLLDRAEAFGAVPQESEYKTQLDLYERTFVLFVVALS